MQWTRSKVWLQLQRSQRHRWVEECLIRPVLMLRHKQNTGFKKHTKERGETEERLEGKELRLRAWLHCTQTHIWCLRCQARPPGVKYAVAIWNERISGGFSLKYSHLHYCYNPVAIARSKQISLHGMVCFGITLNAIYKIMLALDFKTHSDKLSRSKLSQGSSSILFPNTASQLKPTACFLTFNLYCQVIAVSKQWTVTDVLSSESNTCKPRPGQDPCTLI